MFFLVLLSLLVQLSLSVSAIPPDTASVMYSTATFVTLSIALGNPPGLISAIRHEELQAFLPAVCSDICQPYGPFETSCLLQGSEDSCGEHFCTHSMINQFYECTNCLLYVANTTFITEPRYFSIQSQLSILSNSCSSRKVWISPSVNLASYAEIGSNTNNETDFMPPSVVLAYQTSGSERLVSLWWAWLIGGGVLVAGFL